MSILADLGDPTALVAGGSLVGVVGALALALVRAVSSSGKDYDAQAKRWQQLLDASRQEAERSTQRADEAEERAGRAEARAEKAEERAAALSGELDELRGVVDSMLRRMNEEGPHGA